MPTINKPTRVRRIAATVADHVVTNNVMSVIQRRSGIIKPDTLDHVPIAFPLNTFLKSMPQGRIYLETHLQRATNKVTQAWTKSD